VQPEYNEDRAFEALIHPTNGITPVSYSGTESSDGSVRKPDHLVVVYKVIDLRPLSYLFHYHRMLSAPSLTIFQVNPLHSIAPDLIAHIYLTYILIGSTHLNVRQKHRIECDFCRL
jgi:hypothetical protein